MPFDLNWKILIGVAFVTIGAIGGMLLTQGFQQRSADTAVPKISFQKVAYFWIDMGHGINQIGAVLQLANMSSNQGLIKSVTLLPQGALPQGYYHFKKIFIDPSPVEISSNTFVPANSNQWFKALLPIKFDINFTGGPSHPANVLFVGQWSISFGRGNETITPEFIGTFERVITEDEWASILLSSSTISPDSIRVGRPQPLPDTSRPVKEFVLFNADQSATFTAIGFSTVPPVRNQNGTIVFVRGWGTPSFNGGWRVLGTSYDEAWSNPETLAIYNSVVPPDATTGKPHNIGVFQ